MPSIRPHGGFSSSLVEESHGEQDGLVVRWSALVAPQISNED